MDRELPPFERPPASRFVPAAEGRRHFNRLIIFGIPIFAMISFYLAIAVATQVDSVFFPGNELSLGIAAPGIDAGDNPDHADINQRINILIMGLDQRRDEPDDQPYRTDTVMILTIDPFAKRAATFSIPRDTLVEIPDGDGGYVKDRINVAYEMGQYTYKDYPGGGPGLLEDTIEHNFDIPIDNYVVVNFNNFISLIDRLGGIDVTIPEYAYDPAYSDCNRCETYPVEFDPGTEHMDGERALAYARIRHSDNDFKRIERQQIVLRATIKKGADLGILLGNNPKSLYNAYKDAVKTDISDFRIPGLAKLGQQIGIDNIRTISMADATYACNCSTAAYLLWDRARFEELKSLAFGNGELDSEAAVVKVINGTSTPDLAATFASFLKRQGLTDGQLRLDEYDNGQLYNSTMVVDLTGKTFTSGKLRDWLDLSSARVLTKTDPQATPFLAAGIDVVVVLGADVHLPTTTANGTPGVAPPSYAPYYPTPDYSTPDYSTPDSSTPQPTDGAEVTPTPEDAGTPEPTLAGSPEPSPTDTREPLPTDLPPEETPLETPVAGG